MTMKKRLVSVIIIALIFVITVAAGTIKFINKGNKGIFKNSRKETIHLWYTDESMTDYLNNKAVAYNEKNDIRVEIKNVSGLEYLEAINKASISDEEDLPDVYIISNDSLEKAYLAGLVQGCDKKSYIQQNDGLCQTAIDAVTYNDKIMGVPLYYETAALLYNKSYLQQIADATNQSTESEDSESDEDNNDKVNTISADDLIPKSIADIVNFADQYSTPDNVEYFFTWDVSDIFYNYFFIGNYIDVGGNSGDNKEQIDIYNDGAIASLKVYQQMSQFFSIDTKENKYDKVINEFLEGKTIYTIATSDCLSKIEEARKEGNFDFEYGIASLPDINNDLKTKGMSVTNVLVVNAYSEHKDVAADFISFIGKEAGNDLYSYSGKLPVAIGEVYNNENLAVFASNYADSVPMPKMLETSNFWVELEGCFAKVWNGTDANTELKTLAEKIYTQLEGKEISLNRLIAPEVQLLSDEEQETD